jgi:hypothetical protein
VKSRVASFLALLAAFVRTPAFDSYAEGHEVVAIIAADDLTAGARARMAWIGGLPLDMSRDYSPVRQAISGYWLSQLSGSNADHVAGAIL